jgi:hypothetical protein
MTTLYLLPAYELLRDISFLTPLMIFSREEDALQQTKENPEYKGSIPEKRYIADLQSSRVYVVVSEHGSGPQIFSTKEQAEDYARYIAPLTACDKFPEEDDDDDYHGNWVYIDCLDIGETECDPVRSNLGGNPGPAPPGGRIVYSLRFGKQS